MKISIIIPLLNGEAHISYLLNSILRQKILDYEIVIKDGLSSDDSINIINKYNLKNCKIISCSDNGIYNAMNQALIYASGDWIIFMGADDIFLEELDINYIFNHVEIREYDLIYGDFITDKKKFRAYFNWRLLNGNSINHQSVFYRRSIFQKYKYDEKYKIASDYKLNLQLYLKKYRGLYIKKNFSNFGHKGLSMTHKNIGFIESNAIRLEIFGVIFGSLLNFLIKAKNILK